MHAMMQMVQMIYHSVLQYLFHNQIKQLSREEVTNNGNNKNLYAVKKLYSELEHEPDTL